MKISEYNNYNRINQDNNAVKYDTNRIASEEQNIISEDSTTVTSRPEETKQEPDSDNNSSSNLLDSQQAAERATEYDMKTDKSLIGSNSDLAGLDITKEISSMKKDSILREYSYFINDIDPEDGFVIRKKL